MTKMGEFLTPLLCRPDGPRCKCSPSTTAVELWWIRGDNSWGGRGAGVSQSRLVGGPATLQFVVPATASPGHHLRRFRFDRRRAVFNWAAADGEVEDYAVSHRFRWPIILSVTQGARQIPSPSQQPDLTRFTVRTAARPARSGRHPGATRLPGSQLRVRHASQGVQPEAGILT